MLSFINENPGVAALLAAAVLFIAFCAALALAKRRAGRRTAPQWKRGL